MDHIDIINLLIKKNNFQTYLEIGVSDPKNCFDKIKVTDKASVDPGIEFKENPVEFRLTSDKFFKHLENSKTRFDKDFKWDIIFIDGLHLAEQVYRDIKNSLNHISDNGFIILHDCNPPNSYFAREDYMVNGVYDSWNGTTWKAFYKIRTEGLNIETYTIDTDWGLGVIKKANKPNHIPFENPFFEYNIMSENRQNHLGLISINEFLDKI